PTQRNQSITELGTARTTLPGRQAARPVAEEAAPANVVGPGVIFEKRRVMLEAIQVASSEAHRERRAGEDVDTMRDALPGTEKMIGFSEQPGTTLCALGAEQHGGQDTERREGNVTTRAAFVNGIQLPIGVAAGLAGSLSFDDVGGRGETQALPAGTTS